MTTSNTRPSARAVLTDPVLLLAFGLGSGLSPRAPGTAGSLLAMLLFPLLSLLPLGLYLLFVLAFSLVAIGICGSAEKKLGLHDHGGIVIDEVAGIWLAMAAMPATLPWMVAGFVVFRLFDIVKPWPIRLLDRHVRGGLGIMLDDLAAGAFTWLVLAIAQFLLGGFGS